MSFGKKSIITAIIAALAIPSAAIAGAAGGGTELPSDAAGKGSQSPKAGGAGNPKDDSMKKDGSMEKGGGSMEKKSGDKM